MTVAVAAKKKKTVAKKKAVAPKKAKTRHYVVFYSPGTFFDESSTREIDKWDVDKVVKMAKNITERYNAKPYGFQFHTDQLKANKDGSKTWQVTKESKLYFLGGTVLTYDQITERNDPKDDILLSNMRCNDWNEVIVNDNSWRVTKPYDRKNNVILDVKL